MINRIIHWSLHNRFLVLAAFFALCAWGVVAIRRVPIDAIPDLSENQVIVFTDWMGRSPKEIDASTLEFGVAEKVPLARLTIGL